MNATTENYTLPPLFLEKCKLNNEDGELLWSGVEMLSRFKEGDMPPYYWFKYRWEHSYWEIINKRIITIQKYIRKRQATIRTIRKLHLHGTLH